MDPETLGTFLGAGAAAFVVVGAGGVYALFRVGTYIRDLIKGAKKMDKGLQDALGVPLEADSESDKTTRPRRKTGEFAAIVRDTVREVVQDEIAPVKTELNELRKSDARQFEMIATLARRQNELEGVEPEPQEPDPVATARKHEASARRHLAQAEQSTARGVVG